MKQTYKSTKRQKQAICFCESVLNIQFKDNINSKHDCGKFLRTFLPTAKNTYLDLHSQYIEFIEDLY